jgi:hypothetical protein
MCERGGNEQEKQRHRYNKAASRFLACKFLPGGRRVQFKLPFDLPSIDFDGRPFVDYWEKLK